MTFDKKNLMIRAFSLLFILLFLSTTTIFAQRKKSAAQINSEKEIDSKRLEINQLINEIALKKEAIEGKEVLFNEQKATHEAEDKRIENRDNVVKNRESCLSNLLADALPYFATEVITEYEIYRNGGAAAKKIEEFAFAPKMIEVLQSSYELAHKEHLSTFVDNTDRVAFVAYADETFDQYFLGGVDRSGESLEGILSEHFHPKNLPTIYDVAQPLADKYIGDLAALDYVDTKTMNMAKAMPIEFYVGWNRFINECGLIVVSTMKDKRRKERIAEVEAQAILGVELREAFLQLEALKEEQNDLKEQLYIAESNLKFLEETYQKQYKKVY